ncbi:MAG: hypothetical protein IT323_21400 [Anaerolineae bacterium]|nr:hypothetical protein [Anaerolineae bacterium]
MHTLFIFLDGIGLGADDPALNPFAAAHTPALWSLTGGARWLRNTPRLAVNGAVFAPTDPRLGVPGRPQSATGQAAIFTGRNVPAELGEHYGPRPTPAIRSILAEDNLLKRLVAAGKRLAFLDAYPPRFFDAVGRGKRLLSALQQAVFEAGVPLRGEEDLRAGRAFSADFTGQGWRDVLGFGDTPVWSPEEAGARLADEARGYDFSLISTWITDEIGHRGPLAQGVAFLELFDRVLAGLLRAWDTKNDLIILTSDHGNLEDVAIRQHTENDVPTLAIGAERHTFADGLAALTDITPGVLRALGVA